MKVVFAWLLLGSRGWSESGMEKRNGEEGGGQKLRERERWVQFFWSFLFSKRARRMEWCELRCCMWLLPRKMKIDIDDFGWGRKRINSLIPEISTIKTNKKSK